MGYWNIGWGCAGIHTDFRSTIDEDVLCHRLWKDRKKAIKVRRIDRRKTASSTNRPTDGQTNGHSQLKRCVGTPKNWNQKTAFVQFLAWTMNLLILEWKPTTPIITIHKQHVSLLLRVGIETFEIHSAMHDTLRGKLDYWNSSNSHESNSKETIKWENRGL